MKFCCSVHAPQKFEWPTRTWIGCTICTYHIIITLHRIRILLLDTTTMKRSSVAAVDALNATSKPYEALDSSVYEACRQPMIQWCHQVRRALKLSPDTIAIAVSCMDRYLDSGRCRSSEVLADRYKFQLSAITALYIAVKHYEPSVLLSVDALVRLCKGYYKREHILAMERDMLVALECQLTLPAQPTTSVPLVANAPSLALMSSEEPALARIAGLIDVMEAQDRLLDERNQVSDSSSTSASSMTSSSSSSLRSRASKSSQRMQKALKAARW